MALVYVASDMEADQRKACVFWPKDFDKVIGLDGWCMWRQIWKLIIDNYMEANPFKNVGSLLVSKRKTHACSVGA